MKKLIFLTLLLCVTASMQAYVPSRTLANGSVVFHKWANPNSISWRLNTTQGTNITGSRSMSSVIDSSFAAWDAVTSADITITRGADGTALTIANDGVNVIQTNLGPTAYTNVAGDALGLTILYTSDNTGLNVDGDIIFNPTVSFSLETTTPADKYDFQAVLTHEIGHFLGLDHSSVLSATMFPTIGQGVSIPRALSADDIAGIGNIYPNSTHLAKGTITGTVRTLANVGVYGALVVAVNSNGTPVAQTISDPQGNYVLVGIDAGTYTILAEPMDGPYTSANQDVIEMLYPNRTISTSFTTRFR